MTFDPAEPRDADGRWLYHGTSKALARVIEQEGLRPGAHLTSNRDAAALYARYASGGRYGSKDKRTAGVVLRVKVQSGETKAGAYGPESVVTDHRVTTVHLAPSRVQRDATVRGTSLSTRYERTRHIDLASPGVNRRERPEMKHVVPPPVDADVTVRAIADILKVQSRFKRLPTDFGHELQGLEHLLAPYGIHRTAIRMALGLTHKEGGGRRGTAHAPNARLAEHEATLDEQVREVRDFDLYFRSAYVANAANRMQRTMNQGGTQRDALRAEAQFYRMHEEARRGRLRAVAQVQQAAKLYGHRDDNGTLVGWYLNPLLNNEVECVTANGHNFYAEKGTTIGLPGSVHNRCGCYAGPPHESASLVNDALHNVVKFQRVRPKFKVKERRTA